MHRHARLVVAGALLLSLAVIAIAWSTHQHHQAQTEALAADRRASAQAAVEQLVADGEDLRDRLSERIAAGQAVAEAGPTAEPGVMQALEETLSTARSHRDAPAPEVPPDADARTLDETRETSEAWVRDLTWITDELAANIREAEASQRRYREEPDPRHTEDTG